MTGLDLTGSHLQGGPQRRRASSRIGVATPGERMPVLGLAVARFQSPVPAKGIGQLATSFGCFLGLCAAMYVTVDLSYWLTLGLGLLASGFLVRIFIVQHDCGHGSFFASRRANDLLGVLCSLLTLAPYAAWRRQHAGHHGVWNHLDRRASGLDIYSACLTVTEYLALGRWRRWLYRLARHPIVSNILLPPLVFLVLYRLPFDMPKSWKRERRAVYATDLALVAIIGGQGLLLGFDRVAAVQLPIIVAASMIGVWLFSVQHRFEHALWVRHERWSFAAAALRGSSFLRLPAILQWFTGNIGFHHVHHLNPRIPNYRLQECHDSHAALQEVPVLTLGGALTAWRYTLWAEDENRMVGFSHFGGARPRQRGADADRRVQASRHPNGG